MQCKEEGIISMLEKGTTIKILGDSITAGGGSSDDNRTGDEIATLNGNKYLRQLGSKCWASLFSHYIQDKYPKSKVINNGCSGITSTVVSENLRQLCDSNDDIIIIMIGTNDRKQEDGMRILYDNLIYIINQMRSKRIVLMSPNPSRVVSESYKNRLFHQEDVNNTIAMVAEQEQIQLISHFNFIQNYLLYTNKSMDELMYSDDPNHDGIHPTDFVHNLIYRNLVQSLNLGIKVEGATW